ncbi:uncharacterized protein [Haliotis cracherodii]|uniref:uncharacterized protein n=1 Tax=Haliotis cracherodii TaxID=6455 RepID=UPI0039EBEA9D
MFSMAIALGLLATCAHGSQKPETCARVGKPAFGGPRDIATISSSDEKVLVAPTGLASSGVYVDVLYYINADTETENYNRVYAINAHTGEVVGAITITNAMTDPSENWQGLAVQGCPEPMDGSCIFVHDVGLNIVYIVQEESNPASFTMKDAAKIIMYTYKDAGTVPSTSRSIFVDCQGGIYFFSAANRGRGVRLYKIIENDDGTYTAEPKLQLDIPTASFGPTAASLSRDCCELVVRTEDKIYYYPWVDMMLQQDHARLLPAVINPYGASIAWALDGSGFYTALESAPMTLAFSPRNKHVPESKFTLGRVIGGVAKEPFVEIAGIAASREHPGILYMMSDEQTTDILVVQMNEGQVVSTYSSGISLPTIDWEDIAVGPSFDGTPGSSSIYINDGGADFGGPVNRIYIISETETPYVNTVYETFNLLVYSYLGNNIATHALMVGCDGEIYVFDYAQNFGDPINVYKLIKTSVSVYAAVVIATIPNPSLRAGPEAADISACCDEILVKYIDGVFKYSLTNNDVASAFLRDPTSLPYIPETDGASIAITADCKAYLTTEDQDTSFPAPLKKYERISCCKNETYNY